MKLARRRSHRAYRVYAEDDFLTADDPTAEGTTPGDSHLAEAPPYTAAARRGLPGPLGGRVGVLLVALVAMAVSALVVHALRAGLGGGAERPSPVTASVATAATHVRGRTPVYGGTRVQGMTPRLAPHAGSAAYAGSGQVNRSSRPRTVHGAVRERAGERSSSFAPRSAPVMATTSTIGEASVPSAASTVAPEFGFER